MIERVELHKGGEGEALRLVGEILHLVLPRAFAPGAPVDFRVFLDREPLELRGKTVGSKKRPDARFDVRLRMVNLRRDARERLAAIGSD